MNYYLKYLMLKSYAVTLVSQYTNIGVKRVVWRMEESVARRRPRAGHAPPRQPAPPRRNFALHFSTRNSSEAHEPWNYRKTDVTEAV